MTPFFQQVPTNCQNLLLPAQLAVAYVAVARNTRKNWASGEGGAGGWKETNYLLSAWNKAIFSKAIVGPLKSNLVHNKTLHKFHSVKLLKIQGCIYIHRWHNQSDGHISQCYKLTVLQFCLQFWLFLSHSKLRYICTMEWLVCEQISGYSMHCRGFFCFIGCFFVTGEDPECVLPMHLEMHMLSDRSADSTQQ